jgi:formate hydrogenlyase subunit 3/multisubunit Na+/H+ antiporter MnhD subunit
MITRALLLLPLAAGTLAFLLRGDAARRSLLVWTARLHFLLTALAAYLHLGPGSDPGAPGWFAFDNLGLLFLGVTSLLCRGAALYAVRYLALEKRDPG